MQLHAANLSKTFQTLITEMQPSCRLMHHYLRRPGDEAVSSFGCENKKWRTFHLFQELQNWAKLIAKTWQEWHEDNSKGDICYLENICGAKQP